MDVPPGWKEQVVLVEEERGEGLPPEGALLMLGERRDGVFWLGGDLVDEESAPPPELDGCIKESGMLSFCDLGGPHTDESASTSLAVTDELMEAELTCWPAMDFADNGIEWEHDGSSSGSCDSGTLDDLDLEQLCCGGCVADVAVFEKMGADGEMCGPPGLEEACSITRRRLAAHFEQDIWVEISPSDMPLDTRGPATEMTCSWAGEDGSESASETNCASSRSRPSEAAPATSSSWTVPRGTDHRSREKRGRNWAEGCSEASTVESRSFSLPACRPGL